MANTEPVVASRTVPWWRRPGRLALVVLVVVALVAVAAVEVSRARRGTSAPVTPVSVILQNRLKATGLTYDGRVYVPATAVAEGFDLESEPSDGGGVKLAGTLDAPLIVKKHDPLGSWLYGEKNTVETWKNVVMDKTLGLPKTVYPFGTFLYPVTVAHYGLEQYSKWAVKSEENAKAAAIKVGDWFVAQQDARGGWPVPFDYDFRKNVTSRLTAGWYSGMAQGMAADLLAKLYKKTQDERYRKAALKSLDALSLSVEKGGVKRMFEGAYEWWEEYPVRNHPVYVLNGFIYALVGVYDTAVLLDDQRARAMYERGLRSLVRMVNLYDLGTRTAYDLLHYSVPGTPPNIARWGYHNTHVMLLSAMDVIEPGAFSVVEKRWLGYTRGIAAPHN